MKLILFSFFYLLLCIPGVQHFSHVFYLKKLEGVEVKTEKVKLNMSTWMDGRFQQTEERRLNETAGMRELLIRAYNQFNYSLFQLTESPGVVIGKKNYLYLTSYTDNYTGINFIGWNVAESNVKRLKMLQNFLKKKNIDLVVAFAPGKASFYPEYIPEEILKNKKQNNYDAYCRLFIKEGVNFLDINALFNKRKSEAAYKLYPKYGVHWSYYGAYLAADTLKKYIEALHQCTLTDIILEKVTESDSVQKPDYDIGELLNIFTVEKETMPYPVLSYAEKNDGLKTSGLIISDSYAWHWMTQNLLQSLFTDWAFWYYNKTMYPESLDSTTTTSGINYAETIQKKDIIVILASEGTLHLFPYEFLEKAENVFLSGTREDKIYYYTLKINSDAAWLADVRKKAAERNIHPDSMISKDAEWMADNSPVK